MTVRNDLELIVDKNGDPLPQRYNPVTGEMELEDNNVQLTGRNVELHRELDFEIAAGALVVITRDLKITDYDWVSVNVGASGNLDFKIRVRQDRSFRGSESLTESTGTDEEEFNGFVGSTNRHLVRADEARIEIQNLSEDSYFFDVQVIGGR